MDPDTADAIPQVATSGQLAGNITRTVTSLDTPHTNGRRTPETPRTPPRLLSPIELLVSPVFPTLEASSVPDAAERNKEALDTFLFDWIFKINDRIWSQLSDTVRRRYRIPLRRDQVRAAFSERMYGDDTPAWERFFIEPRSTATSEISSRRSSSASQGREDGDAQILEVRMTDKDRLRNLDAGSWRELEREYVMVRDAQWAYLAERFGEGMGEEWSVEEVRKRWEEY